LRTGIEIADAWIAAAAAGGKPFRSGSPRFGERPGYRAPVTFVFPGERRLGDVRVGGVRVDPYYEEGVFGSLL
jgi:hypothetical protein